jgi:alcohol dehydrogenase class IV
MVESATFSFPTTIHFGVDVVDEVASHLRDVDVARPLVVADRDVAALPFCARLVDSIASAGLVPDTYDDFGGDPVRADVVRGAEAFVAHRADSIVGVGGGVALDVAKAVALVVGAGGDLFDYEDRPDARPVAGQLPYWVAVPTTAGTGSEVGRSAVIGDDETHRKRVIFSPAMLARVVFADPRLTVGLPAGITAATGMDALTHCIEAYLARDYHPLCDGVAVEGLRLGARALPRCVDTPGDLDARGDQLMAAMMGAVAFQKGLGLVHSCAHALAAVTGLHHGLANGVMIDHALGFNAPAVPERFATLAQTVGLADTEPEAFLAWLADLKREVGIPAGLDEAGVDPGIEERLAAAAAADACHQQNPRAVTETDFRTIFASAR